MTDTATCTDCRRAWRGPNAHKRGQEHQDATGHVVWYDTDPDATETEDWTGTWTEGGGRE
jgi:hypothetical protein